MGGAKMDDPFTPDLADFILETMDEWKLAGISIAVVDGDDTFTKGFGHATLPDTPATPETLSYGGSTTKAFTTAALAHLIESGKYPALSKGWQTPVSSIIRDDFVTGDEWATNKLSLEDLASHRSGLTNNDMSIRLEENGKPWTVRDITRNIRNFPLRAQPRTEFDYNNEGYAVLSHVIEKVTGKWLGDVLKEIIWEPLGMNSTFLDLQQAKDAPEHVSTGYYWDENNKRHQEVLFCLPGLSVVLVQSSPMSSTIRNGSDAFFVRNPQYRQKFTRTSGDHGLSITQTLQVDWTFPYMDYLGGVPRLREPLFTGILDRLLHMVPSSIGFPTWIMEL
ncbi:beta-lactamase [Fusarium albosuccineum]|uniref:Beta-lactamase n=1 Tax=Fusarium albosuccineum TaxID=1237068 RepID=A0A8H4P5A3_9HYPO|nr:beta-lactamase [Fusarium albosuccineum]